MTATCWASVRGEVARFTSLDSCCAPVTKACGKVTTTGFISVKLTQEIEAGTVVKIKNAADKLCVYDPGCDVLLDLQAEVVLCQVNPDLVGLITGQEVVLDYAGNSVGFRRSQTPACDLRWAMEVWTDVPGSACVGEPPAKQFGYFLVPCLRNATITGDITIDNANAVTLTLTAKTTVPSLWGTGPATADGAYQVVPTDISNTPGYLLTPIGPEDHDHMQLTSIAPPVIPENCGCEAVTITGTDLTPVISSFTGSPVAAAGGDNVEIIGAHFLGATAVTIGGNPGTEIVVVDDSHIVFKTPAHAAGAVNTTVTTPAGTSAAVAGVTYV